MTIKVLLTIILLSGLAGISAVVGDEAHPVSMIQLIANPEKYDGKLVVVMGYLTLSEHPAVYLHKEDAIAGLLPNALWVEPTEAMRQDKPGLSQNYVKIVGRFRAGSRGHVYFLPGGITEIEECVLWPYRPDVKSPGSRPSELKK